MQEGKAFYQKLLRKAYFIFKMTGPAMVWPASSDFGKAPQDGKRRQYSLYLTSAKFFVQLINTTALLFQTNFNPGQMQNKLH